MSDRPSRGSSAPSDRFDSLAEAPTKLSRPTSILDALVPGGGRPSTPVTPAASRAPSPVEQPSSKEVVMPDWTAENVVRKVQGGEAIERADLRGIDLTGAILEGAKLRRSDLDGANLTSAKLGGAILKNASLRDALLVAADLHGVNLENADLEGANLARANLAGANLHRANLEGAKLEGADLSGARLTHAQLVAASLGGARLVEAIVAHADFGESDCSGATFARADLSSVSFVGANLEVAVFDEALASDAHFRDAQARGASFVRTSLAKADLGGARLASARLEGADLRGARLAGTMLEGAVLTGARLAGAVGTGAEIPGLEMEWLDASPSGDGSRRVTGPAAQAMLTGLAQVAEPRRSHRYFGRGDVLRNAVLQFEDGATVEVESLFEACSITLGVGTELLVGASGILRGCTVRGAGRVTLNGAFLQDGGGGLVGVRQLRVSASGLLVGKVEQPPERTDFAFDPGCALRVDIRTVNAGSENVQVQS